jgi:hypothetical protein
MMKEEQWIWGHIKNKIQDDDPHGKNETKRNEPLGVHFGPLTHFRPALNGHMPNISLSTEVSDFVRQNRTKTGDVTHPPRIWWIAPWEPSPPSKSFWNPTKSPGKPSTMGLILSREKKELRGRVMGGVPSPKPPPDETDV